MKLSNMNWYFSGYGNPIYSISPGNLLNFLPQNMHEKFPEENSDAYGARCDICRCILTFGMQSKSLFSMSYGIIKFNALYHLLGNPGLPSRWA